MKDYLNSKVLVTTVNWFYGPDGKQYRAIWGTLKGVHEAQKVFGFVPSRTHANWFIEIGDITVTGCQVLYCIKCPNKPNDSEVDEWHSPTYPEKEVTIFKRPSVILITN